MIALAKNRSEHLGSISALNLGLILIAAGVVLYFAAVVAKRKKLSAVEFQG
jgi:hypothetical protein